MNLLEALLLGVIQGLTEFLPISSSGHLVLVPALLGWKAAPLVFDTTLHLGTLAAILAVFWRDLWQILLAWWADLRRGKPLHTPESRLAWWILLGTLPAVLTGLLFEETLAALFGTPRAVGIFLLVTALLLVLAELLGRRRHQLDTMTWWEALLIGIGQAAAIAPGLSRSGATIATGMLCGMKRGDAARFSFLLSVPIIAGTGILQLLRLLRIGGGEATAAALVVGFLAAAVTGYAAIRLLLAYVRRRPLYPFAAYCVAVGVFALIVLS